MLGPGDVRGGDGHRLIEAVWKAEEMELGGKDACVGERERALRVGGKWKKCVWSWAFDFSDQWRLSTYPMQNDTVEEQVL